MRKEYFLFFLLCLLSAAACDRPKHEVPLASPHTVKFDEVLSLYDQVQQASYILVAEVQRLESWKGRNDWWIVTLKAEREIKGDAPARLKILTTKLFPHEPMVLKEGERVLVFLGPIPNFTAWKELITHGVQYQVLGGKKGIFKSSSDISLYADYSEQLLKIQAMKDELARRKTLQDFDAEILQKNPPGSLTLAIVENDFQSKPAASLSTEELEFWLTRLKDPRFDNDAKTFIASRFAEVNSLEMNEVLQQMFCLPPSGLCLKVAETLESRNLPPPLHLYSSAVEFGDAELRKNLLIILARHQRKDAFKLFEKNLKRETNEKNAAALVEALGDFKSPQAEALVLKYAKDPRYYVRIAVATSLGKLKSSKGIPVLETYLKTKDPSMITAAAQSLKEIGTAQSLQTLGKYYHMGHHGHWEPAEPQHFNMPSAKP